MVYILTGESHGSNESWIEEKIGKSEWSQLVLEGHTVHHHLINGVSSGKIQIDGVVYTYDKARDKYLT